MLFSLSPDSKLHTRVDEKRDRERDGVVWGGDDILHMTPLKRICFTDEACSLARCASTNCYGQSVMHRDMR